MLIALLALWVATVLRETLHPVLFAWANRQLGDEASHVRATVLSIWSQADSLGQIVGGPAIGAVGNASLRLALTASGLLVGLKLPLYRRALA